MKARNCSRGLRETLDEAMTATDGGFVSDGGAKMIVPVVLGMWFCNEGAVLRGS